MDFLHLFEIEKVNQIEHFYFEQLLVEHFKAVLKMLESFGKVVATL
jgi:hypothetical protein